MPATQRLPLSATSAVWHLPTPNALAVRSQPSEQAAEMASWVTINDNSDFSLQNLPYGMFSTGVDPQPRIGTAIGQYVLDLKALAQDGLFSDIGFDSSTLEGQTLNEYDALDKRVHR